MRSLRESTKPVAVLRRATVCLLQTLVLVAGVHADHLQPGAVRVVSGLLRSIADSGSKIVSGKQKGQNKSFELALTCSVPMAIT